MARGHVDRWTATRGSLFAENFGLPFAACLFGCTRWPWSTQTNGQACAGLLVACFGLLCCILWSSLYCICDVHLFCATFPHVIIVAMSHHVMPRHRCRTLYEKYLEWQPANCHAWIKFADLEKSLGEAQRTRGIYELAISQPVGCACLYAQCARVRSHSAFSSEKTSDLKAVGCAFLHAWSVHVHSHIAFNDHQPGGGLLWLACRVWACAHIHSACIDL